MFTALGVAIVLGFGAQEESSAPRLALYEQDPLPDGESYRGGRGLITDNLATGLFINPTSGTLPAGKIDLEYCALIFKPGSGDSIAVGHGAIASYGLTHWLEIGAVSLLADIPVGGGDLHVSGPMARARLLKDEQWWPEVGVGSVLLFGDDALEKNTVFVAASKAVPLPESDLFRSARAHLGFRQGWLEVGDDDESFVYLGGEVELPQNVFAVAEISNKDNASKHPWAAGLQVRHPNGFGFTLAAVQAPLSQKLAVYVGVGINFSR